MKEIDGAELGTVLQESRFAAPLYIFLSLPTTLSFNGAQPKPKY